MAFDAVRGFRRSLGAGKSLLFVRAMTEVRVADPTHAQLQTILRWLKREHVEDLESSGGFYCNRAIIRQSFKESEIKCLILGRTIIGFTTFRLSSAYSAIDIFEIRPGYRQRGYGKNFAQHMINFLFTEGAPHITVECAPRSSEQFWRSLGFVESGKKYHDWSNPRLSLPAP